MAISDAQKKILEQAHSLLSQCFDELDDKEERQVHPEIAAALKRDKIRLFLESHRDLIERCLTLALRHAASLHDDHVKSGIGCLHQIGNHIVEAGQWNDKEWIQRIDKWLSSQDHSVQYLYLALPFMLVAEMDSVGLAHDAEAASAHLDKLKSSMDAIRQDMEVQAKAIVEDMSARAAEEIQKARDSAANVFENVRRAAEGVSLEVAQRQFREAHERISRRVLIWAVLALVFFVGFLVLAHSFLGVSFSSSAGWESNTYRAVVRLMILSAWGVGVTYSLRMLRAHIHMGHANQHRISVVNSIHPLAESAEHTETRDLIRTSIVDAVVSFGPSGLLTSEGEALPSSRLQAQVAEALTKTAKDKASQA